MNGLVGVYFFLLRLKRKEKRGEGEKKKILMKRERERERVKKTLRNTTLAAGIYLSFAIDAADVKPPFSRLVFGIKRLQLGSIDT